jgi:hypothetical protein
MAELLLLLGQIVYLGPGLAHMEVVALLSLMTMGTIEEEVEVELTFFKLLAEMQQHQAILLDSLWTHKVVMLDLVEVPELLVLDKTFKFLLKETCHQAIFQPLLEVS